MSQLLKLNPNFKTAFDGLSIALDLITKIIQKKQVVKVYLFGSSASKKNSINSDLDILVVIPNGSNIQDYYEIVQQPFFSPVAVDWIFKFEDEFNLRKEIGGVCFESYHHGKLIYNG